MVIHCIFRDTSGLISLVVCVLYIYSTIFQVVPEVRRFVFNRSVCRDVDTCLAHVYKNGIYIYIYQRHTPVNQPSFSFSTAVWTMKATHASRKQATNKKPVSTNNKS